MLGLINIKEENDAEACGQVKVECRSEDTLWVKYGEERWRNQAFIRAVLRAGDNPEQVTCDLIMFVYIVQTFELTN